MAIDTALLICPAVLQLPFVDKDGLPLANGVVTFYEEDQTTLKNVYEQTGTFPDYEYIAVQNPMTLSAAGTPEDLDGNDIILFYYPYVESGPLAGQAQPYFITVYNSNGQFQFSRDDFPFTSNSGPVPPPLITGPQFENYLANNRFWRNIGTTNIGTISTTATSGTWTTQYAITNPSTVYWQRLAPDQHDGFSMPDINYIQDQNGGNQTITFNKFALSNTPVLLDDVQPEYYLNYTCLSDSSGAMLKCIQFPVSLHLATLAGQPLTFTIQTQVVSGAAPTLNICLFQFNGTGQSSPVPTQVGQVITSGNAWAKTVINTSFSLNTPSVAGGPADDAWYIQIRFPTGSTNAPCNINIAIPSVYIDSSITSETQVNAFATYDQIDSIIAAPRTGDIKISMHNFYPFGWIPMNGGTLANTGTITAPTNIPITYQGTDGWRLFEQLWTKFSPYTSGTSNPLAQMYNSAGSAVAYGGTAYGDWTSNNQLQISNALGQVLMGTVPVTAMANSYSTTFTASQITTTFSASVDGAGQLVLSSSHPVAYGEILKFSTSSALPGNLDNMNNFYCAPLSTGTFLVVNGGISPFNLLALNIGNFIFYSGAGTGTQTLVSQSLVITTANAMKLYRGAPVTFSVSTGGTLPNGLSAGVVYYALPSSSTTLCLATSFANAMSGNVIAYSAGASSGTFTITYGTSGMYGGEFAHTQLTPETPYDFISGINTANGNAYDLLSGTSGSLTGLYASLTFANGTGQGYYTTGGPAIPINIIQPNYNMNFFIKL